MHAEKVTDFRIIKNKGIKNFFIISISLIIILVMLSSCGIFSLEELEVQFGVTEMNEIITDNTVLYAQFNMSIVKEEAEQSFSVKNSQGKVNGDISWTGNRLIFTPLADLLPGKRYTITVQGDIGIDDGRSFMLKEIIPFYFTSSARPVLLSSMIPAPNDNFNALGELVFTFSRGINETSFIDNFKLSPVTEFTHIISADNTIITITPDPHWQNLINYNWSLSKDCTDINDIALLQAYSDTFFVLEDIIPPQLLSITSIADFSVSADPVPVIYYVPIGSDLINTVTYKNSLLFEFSEEIDFANLQDSISISPTTAGTWFQENETLFIFTPESGWTMAEEYSITIRESLTDLYGNALQLPDPILFIPNIPLLSVDQIDIGADSFLPDKFNNSASEDFTVIHDVSFGFRYQNFTFHFNQTFVTVEEKLGAVDAISVKAFSGTSAQLSISDVLWENDNKLTITFQGFPALTIGPPEIPIYFEVKIKGSSSGLHNANGSFLTDEIILFLLMKNVEDV